MEVNLRSHCTPESICKSFLDRVTIEHQSEQTAAIPGDDDSALRSENEDTGLYNHGAIRRGRRGRDRLSDLVVGSDFAAVDPYVVAKLRVENGDGAESVHAMRK